MDRDFDENEPVDIDAALVGDEGDHDEEAELLGSDYQITGDDGTPVGDDDDDLDEDEEEETF